MSDVPERIGAGVPETPDRDGAFPGLERGAACATARPRQRSEGRAGRDPLRGRRSGSDFFVVESGAIAIVQGLGAENRVIAIHGEHRFLGELSLLTGQRLYLTEWSETPAR